MTGTFLNLIFNTRSPIEARPQQVGSGRQPASPRNLRVPILPVLGLQKCAILSGLFKMWIWGIELVF